MVRTYWFLPVFNEASGNLDLQPFARTDHVEACRPRAMCWIDCTVSGVTDDGDEFDAIVLGAGAPARSAPGGSPTAGLEVAIVEQHLVGGECSYYACMPSKALLRPGDLLRRGDAACPGRRRPSTGRPRPAGGARPPRRGGPRPRRLRPAALARRTRDRAVPRRGRARWRAAGDGRRRGAAGPPQPVVVATGSGAAMPPIEGLDSMRAWNNRRRDHVEARAREHDRARRRPGRLASSAQAWSTLGAEVTLVEGGRAAARRARSPSPASRSRRRCARSTASTSAPGRK